MFSWISWLFISGNTTVARTEPRCLQRMCSILSSNQSLGFFLRKHLKDKNGEQLFMPSCDQGGSRVHQELNFWVHLPGLNLSSFPLSHVKLEKLVSVFILGFPTYKIKVKRKPILGEHFENYIKQCSFKMVDTVLYK